MGAIGQLRHSIVSQLLTQEDFILIVVNPNCPGVHLPESLMLQKQPVPLHIGWRMAVPISDLKLDEQGISGTLSFNRTPFGCILPWDSIMQVSLTDEHLIWLCPPLEVSPKDEAPQLRSERPKLRLV